MEDDATKQKRISGIAFAGMVMLGIGLVGVVFSILFAPFVRILVGPSAGFATIVGLLVVCMLVGIGLLLYGLGASASEAFGNPANKPVQHAGPVYVVSCFPYLNGTEMVATHDLDLYDEDQIKWIVTIRFQNGAQKDMETAPEVVNMLAEGLWGNITYQGRWLSSFQRVLVDRQR